MTQEEYALMHMPAFSAKLSSLRQYDEKTFEAYDKYTFDFRLYKERYAGFSNEDLLNHMKQIDYLTLVFEFTKQLRADLGLPEDRNQ